ncbi:MAG TPA: peptidoglycan DD-metalloendopeptidase family protein [Thermaerobacter sp.]
MQDTPQSGQSRLRDRLAGLASVFRRPGIRSLAGFVVLAGVFLGSYLYFQGWPGLNEPKPVALENRDTAEEAGPGQEAAPSTAPETKAPEQEATGTSAPAEPRDNVPTREVSGSGRPVFTWPVAGGKTLTGFGWQYSETMGDWRWHPGVDLSAGKGATVAAAADGRVASVRQDEERGLTVIIEHDGDYRTVYASLAEARVKVGDTVRRDQVIGRAGDSARVELGHGVHVHFEIWRGDEAVDPATVIR